MNEFVSSIMENRIARSIRSRILEFNLTNEMLLRVRLILLLTAVLSFYIAFQMGDDWYVREYANYDWARHIGY